MKQQGDTLILNQKENKSISINLSKFLLLNSSLIFGFILVLVGFGLSITYKKGMLLQILNTKHTIFLDYFFKYITYLGDAIVYIPLAVIFYFIDKKKIRLLIYLLVIQTFFSLIFKELFFSSFLRPKGFFSKAIFNQLHTVEGVTIHCCNSFPSGHTITAFALAFFFVFTHKLDLKIQWILVFLAALAGISRVYLLQHFFMDITFGAFLGILSAFLVSKFHSKIKIPKLK